MYVMEIGCLLLSVLGIFGACKGKRWCLILVTMSSICLLQFFFKNEIVFFFDALLCVCGQYAAGMAAASQTIIIRTALSYQDLYEVSRCCFSLCSLVDRCSECGISSLSETRCPWGIQAALHDATDWNQQGQQDAALQHPKRGKHQWFLLLCGF